MTVASLEVASPARVVSAQLFEVRSALVKPYRMSSGAWFSAQAVLLKLTDADGMVGWGEANPEETFSGESPRSVRLTLERTLLPAVLASKSPLPAQMDLELDALVPGNLCAKGAISMALLDLLGRRLNVPVSTLLGGALRSSLPVLWPISNGSAADDIAVIDERIEQGFTTFMLKMGMEPALHEIQRVASLEDRYGDRIKLIPDANQGWSRNEARLFLEGVNPQRIVFVEQLLEQKDLAGMAELVTVSDIPLSADESVIELNDAARIAEMGAASVFSLKSSKNGGPLRTQRVAAVAEAFGIRCYMNSMIEFGISQAASLQHAVTIRNLVDAGHAFMSTLRITEDPTDFSSFVRDGIVHAPNLPGLGIQVDEAHVQRWTVNSSIIEGANGSVRVVT